MGDCDTMYSLFQIWKLLKLTRIDHSSISCIWSPSTFPFYCSKWHVPGLSFVSFHHSSWISRWTWPRSPLNWMLPTWIQSFRVCMTLVSWSWVPGISGSISAWGWVCCYFCQRGLENTLMWIQMTHNAANLTPPHGLKTPPPHMQLDADDMLHWGPHHLFHHVPISFRKELFTNGVDMCRPDGKSAEWMWSCPGTPSSWWRL